MIRHASCQKHRRRGFTLIELSIVLVIIGLIVGGILVGRDLIRAASIRAVISEHEKIETAIMTFKSKYNGLPGDITDATQIWGTDPNGCPTWVSNSVPKTETCNGDGNGHIGSSGDGGPDMSTEVFRSWQQLADAGLISGSYTGVFGPSGASDAIPGVNVPGSRMANAGWTLYYYWQSTVSGTAWAFPPAHKFDFGAYYPGMGTSSPIFTPLEAMNIDSKIDDGKPATGRVITYRWSQQVNCTDLNSYNSQDGVTYLSSYSGIGCSLIFIGNF